MEVANHLPLISRSTDVSDRAKRFTSASLIAAIFFLAIAPTLTWMRFSKIVENLNIETALEIRRGGPVLIPTLMGEPRVRKPPLTACITASMISPLTVQEMSSPDVAVRESAWKNLAWETRWPALLCAGLTLALAYELGAILLDHVGGILGAIVAGTSLLFLRYARVAATDVQLALWVTAANVCLAKFVFQRKYFLGSIGAGVALGLAMMSKGPVALVMTLAPLTVFLVIFKPELDWRKAILPAVIGLLAMLIIGFAWFAYAWWNSFGATKLWFMEIFRTDPAEAATSHWYDYFMLIPLLLPWMFFVLAGAGNAIAQMFSIKRSMDRDRALRVFYALLLILVPLLIMSFFRDRKVRYLYPFSVPCGILGAHALLQLFRHGIRTIGDRIIVWGHWLTLGVYAFGLPICGALGALGLAQVDGWAWYSWRTCSIAIALIAIVFAPTMVAFQRRRIALVVGTMLIMLGLQPLYILGVRNGRGTDGASEMLPVARLLWQRYPDAIAYDLNNGRTNFPPDLAIYLNRPTLRAASIAAIPAQLHPQIYTMLQRHDDPEPSPAAGWRLLVKVPRGRDWHVVFIRDAN